VHYPHSALPQSSGVHTEQQQMVFAGYVQVAVPTSWHANASVHYPNSSVPWDYSNAVPPGPLSRLQLLGQSAQRAQMFGACTHTHTHKHTHTHTHISLNSCTRTYTQNTYTHEFKHMHTCTHDTCTQTLTVLPLSRAFSCVLHRLELCDHLGLGIDIHT